MSEDTKKHFEYRYDTSDPIKHALSIAFASAQIDGSHHKMWTIDQMVRALLSCPLEKQVRDTYTFDALSESEEYKQWIKEYESGEDGPETYSWDEGIAP